MGKGPLPPESEIRLCVGRTDAFVNDTEGTQVFNTSVGLSFCRKRQCHRMLLQGNAASGAHISLRLSASICSEFFFLGFSEVFGVTGLQGMASPQSPGLWN